MIYREQMIHGILDVRNCTSARLGHLGVLWCSGGTLSKKGGSGTLRKQEAHHQGLLSYST